MACQNKYTSLCQNPKCTEAIEKFCGTFKPFPPPITEKEFADKQAEILQNIPKEFRGRLSYMAWQQGHSAGYEEVILDLKELVDNLEEPIKEFEKRLIKQE